MSEDDKVCKACGTDFETEEELDEHADEEHD
jgi:hypothetical protein